MQYNIVPESINVLLNKIGKGELILPSLQREFVWKQKDICKLFDSLMQGYPINTMMFWETQDINNKAVSFYRFLNANYTEGNPNPALDKNLYLSSDKFKVVIDGQQRLTSLLIGLKGSYKTPKAKNKSYLYLCLETPENLNDGEFKYNFSFLTKTKLELEDKVWFKVADIDNPSIWKDTLKRLKDKEKRQEARNMLMQLKKQISKKGVVNYYNIANDDIDEVLEIFVRTNSGGYTLKKSDLLMSALTVSWANSQYQLDARNYVKGIIEEVYQNGCGFIVDKDWVFNVFLMLSGSALGLKPSTFMTNQIPKFIYENRDNIKQSIINAFELVQRFKLLEKGLTTKLAVIPIVYFIYKNNIKSILSTDKKNSIYFDIRKYLFRSIVKNLYEASTDDTLKKIRSIIDKSSTKKAFPYQEIENEYSLLKISNDDISEFLRTKKQNAFPILNIIYALKGTLLDRTTSYDVDHIHPKLIFTSGQILNVTFSSDEDKNKAQDKETYDTVLNLELLDYKTNRSKNKESLDEWFKHVDPTEKQQLLDRHFMNDLPQGIQDFGTFVKRRKEMLQDVLINSL